MKSQILLIDQSIQRSAAIFPLLQQNDFRVLVANNISKSLQHLVNTEFSLVIISASLDEEAMEFSKRIQKYESKYTPVVLMNTELPEETLIAAQQCGISVCLDRRYYLESESAFRRITTKLLQKANQASRACA